MRFKVLKCKSTNEWISKIEEDGTLCTGSIPHLFPLSMTMDNFISYWRNLNVIIDSESYITEVISLSSCVDFELKRDEVIKRLLAYDKEVHYTIFVDLLVDYADVKGEELCVPNDISHTEFCSIFALCPFRREIYIQELDGDNIRQKSIDDFPDLVLIKCLMLLDAGLYHEDEEQYRLVHNK